MAKKSIDDFLGNIGSDNAAKGSLTFSAGARPVSLWFTGVDKARYERLQEATKNGFSKAGRDAFLELMDAAEKKLGLPPITQAKAS